MPFYDNVAVPAVISLGADSFASALVLLFALLIGHALADFPLQGDFLARGKNRHIKPPELANGETPPARMWLYCLSAHSLVHAGFVWVLTGSVLLGFAEFIAHWIIDALKSENAYGFETDQWLHIATKVVFVVLLWTGIV